MENKIIYRAGIKKYKASFIGIFILLFLTALSLSTVLTIYLTGADYIRQEMQRIGFGNLTAWVSNVPDMKTLTDSIKAQDGIEAAEVQNLIFTEYEANGVESDSEGQLIPWNSQNGNYHFFLDDLNGYKEAPEKVTPGTVFVSASMISMMQLEIGDVITFPVARGGKNVSLKVAGYYEDPVMGSSMIGMKGFLISETDYGAIGQMLEDAGMDSLAREGAMIHIFQHAESEASVSDISRLLNENTSISQYTEFIHSEQAIRGFMSILQNAFCGIFAAFALILLLAAMVVLGHSITGMIEQEYRNFGILKTLGLPSNQLIRLQLLQYIIVMGAGVIFGILAAVPTAKVTARQTIRATGVLLPADIQVLPCLVVFAAMLLLLAGTTGLKLRKILSVTPMKAIRGETAEIKGKPGGAIKIKSEGLLFRLAIRQLFSGKRRYVSACLIAVLLVFFASLAGRMNAWLGPEGKGMMDAFNPADLDIAVQALGELDSQEIENMVRSYSDITDSYLLAMPDVSVNGSNYTANVITEPERFHISEGKTSQKSDEVVLTETAASDLAVTIGDKVTIQGDTGSGEFTVSGIYHCANDMGANIGMNREGYLSIGRDDPQIWCRHYFLADTSAKKAITEGLEGAYGGDVHVHENSWPGLGGIISAMQGLLVFMYCMIAAFVLIVTIMVANKILKAEQRDLAIYKSMGYSPHMLRVAFSLRFAVAAALGAAGGTLLAAILTDPLVSCLMRYAGISNFASHPDFINRILPGLSVVFLFAGFSYIAAGRIKKTDMTILTAD